MAFDPNQIPFLLDGIFGQVWLIFKTWWWLVFGLLSYFPAKVLYKWWIHWDIWYKEDNPWDFIEIIPPSLIEKPYRAMEDFYNALFWPLYDSPNWREEWCEGELANGPFWLTFEIVSIEGQIHFYARVPSSQLKLFKSLLHSHYPDADIMPAEDYTKKVPQDLPNKQYKVYGEDYRLFKPSAFPITTYRFFEISPSEVEEEKRVDTFSSLMESMSKLQKGEQLWFQITINSILDSDEPWQTEGKKLVEYLSKRVKKPSSKQPTIAGEAFRLFAFNDMPFSNVKEVEESPFPPEMRLTPGEKNTLEAVEQKIGQNGFRTMIRAFYIADKEAYFSPNGKIIRAYFSHFSTEDLNTVAFFGKTRPKIHYFFRKRRLYTRQRNMFIRFINRFPPLFPQRTGEGTMVLNAEELATIFHLPSKAAILPPGVPRTSGKTGVPPAEIPFEE